MGGCTTGNSSDTFSKVSVSFYHWQTQFSLTETDQYWLDTLHVDRVYTKFFDVDWDVGRKEAVALATVQFEDESPPPVEIVPVVFLTNRTFQHLPAADVPQLAQRVFEKIESILTAGPYTVSEVQMDCDWTKSTRVSYFSFLERLRSKLVERKINLSTTIRLHQIKYPEQTGVPPVDRGVLMYYNMGTVQERTATNSILDNQIGERYLNRLSAYPLPLDVALPLFRWGVLFRRGEMIKLINQLHLTELTDNQQFAKQTDDYWRVVKSGYFGGVYLYEGDELRLEAAEPAALSEAVFLLKKRLKNEDRQLIFYHLDEAVLHYFRPDQLLGWQKELPATN